MNVRGKEGKVSDLIMLMKAVYIKLKVGVHVVEMTAGTRLYTARGG